MASRVAIRNKVAAFFKEEGKILTEEEYRAHKNAPYSIMLVKRSLGTWNAVTRKISAFLDNLDLQVEDLNEDIDKVVEDVTEVIDDVKNIVTAKPAETASVEKSTNEKTSTNK